MTAGKVAHHRLRSREWVIRLPVLIVFLSNLSAALPFLLVPDRFTASFELDGEVGAVMVRSIGLLFLMWIIPYVPILLSPERSPSCLWVILVQQLLGLGGESWMWLRTEGHAVLRATGARFIFFDSVGLALLVVALWLSRSHSGRTGA